MNTVTKVESNLYLMYFNGYLLIRAGNIANIPELIHEEGRNNL